MRIGLSRRHPSRPPPVSTVASKPRPTSSTTAPNQRTATLEIEALHFGRIGTEALGRLHRRLLAPIAGLKQQPDSLSSQPHRARIRTAPWCALPDGVFDPSNGPLEGHHPDTAPVLPFGVRPAQSVRSALLEVSFLVPPALCRDQKSQPDSLSPQPHRARIRTAPWCRCGAAPDQTEASRTFAHFTASSIRQMDRSRATIRTLRWSSPARDAPTSPRRP